jgi:uncharacterized phosphosugar-binding protein
MSESAYIDKIAELLDTLIAEQHELIDSAADLIAESLMNEGVIHIFGTGHSSLIAQEAFMRAGGLLPVNAILDDRILLSGGALNSSAMERQEGLAADILANHDIRASDAGVVVSNSGRNAAPVEMAFEMKKRGIPVIAITSMEHTASVSPSHVSGKKLIDLADITLDNMAPYGDASVEVSGIKTKMGPVSTITGATLINSIFILATEKIAAHGIEPLVLPSGNVEAADFTHIQEAMQKYHIRIKNL